MRSIGNTSGLGHFSRFTEGSNNSLKDPKPKENEREIHTEKKEDIIYASFHLINH